ncbi:MFS transporter [Streptomyces ziwulingensis]|uniref:MFS transporter n=1 Tax=Streptomyces ziwulingensis TaxID=1045501 RepID=A0ABP9B6E3_9ACTN
MTARPSRTRPAHARPSRIRPAHARPSRIRPSRIRPASGRPSVGRLLGVIALVAFVTTADNSVLVAALTSIQAELGLGMAGAQWLGIAYMLAFAGLLPATGPLLDRWGPAGLRAGLLIFASTSLTAALASDAVVLLAARVGQGLGAALVVPGTLRLLRTGLPARHRHLGAAVWTAALAAALALGPWLGGLLTQHGHWSWIFLAHLPPLAAAALLLGRPAPAGPEPARAPVPVAAALLAVAASTALLAGVVGWGEEWSWLPVAVGAAALATLVRHERRSTTPLLPRGAVRNPAVLGSVAVLLPWGIGVSGVVYFTPMVHQEAFAQGPVAASLPLVVIALAVVAAAPAVAPMTRRFGVRTTVLAGCLAGGGGFLALAGAAHAPDLLSRLPGLVLLGLGAACTAPLTAHPLDTVADRDSGTVAALLTAARELAAALGVALLGLVLARDAVADPAHGYATALVIAAGLQAVAAAAALTLLHPPPKQVPA